MKKLPVLLVGATLLSACSSQIASTQDSFTNNNDLSFLRQGAINCPANTVQAGLTGSDRYPLRCGPQTQVIPR